MSEQITFKKQSSRDNSRKICKLLQKVKSDFQNAVVYSSGILPKLGSDVFESINYINETVFNYVQQRMVCFSSVITHLHLIKN